MDQELIRSDIKRYCQNQSDIANEMQVSRIYLNEFLKGRDVGKAMLIKLSGWLGKQLGNEVIQECQTCGADTSKLGFCIKCDTDAHSY